MTMCFSIVGNEEDESKSVEITLFEIIEIKKSSLCEISYTYPTRTIE